VLTRFAEALFSLSAIASPKSFAARYLQAPPLRERQNCLDTEGYSTEIDKRKYQQSMLKSFSSSLRPDEFVTKLKSVVDEEEIDSASPTQFTGDRPVIGRFDTRHFTLHRRAGIHWILWWLTPGQWFKPYLTGSVTDGNSGSLIELTGGTPVTLKILWVLILLGTSGLIATWTIFSYPYNVSHDPAHSGNDMVTGIVCLSLFSGILVLLPIVGWLQTRFHLTDIVTELERHLDLKQID